jgi:hypothetical protein
LSKLVHQCDMNPASIGGVYGVKRHTKGGQPTSGYLISYKDVPPSSALRMTSDRE